MLKDQRREYRNNDVTNREQDKHVGQNLTIGDRNYKVQ